MNVSGVEKQPGPSHIMSLASAFYGSCTLFAASDLGIFARLADSGPADSAAVSRDLELDPRAAELLMDGCVALGLLEKTGELFSNTIETATFLVPGKPRDLSTAIRYNRDVYSAWGKLAELARSGDPVEQPALHLGTDPARTRTFVLSMHGRALGIGRMVLPYLELAGCRKLLDIGGGPGTFSTLIAQANPSIHCTVLDLPDVARVATELVAQSGMSDRVMIVPGDYHTASFPGDNDAVIIFGALHQESPESILSIVQRAYNALNPGGKIFILDIMTDATHANPPFSALFALNMALTTQNGWVFSDAELANWLAQAGFRDCAVRQIPPPMPHWLVSAVK